MKTVLIVSDIHGYKDRFNEILKNETYDFSISLGDSELTSNDLKAMDVLVHGNYPNDVGDAFQILKIEDFTLYITHGHLEKVHANDDILIKKCYEKNIDIVFHGHTHVARTLKVSDKWIINPGAVSVSRSQDPESYIMATFNGSTCEINFKDLSHHSIKKMTINKGMYL